MLLLVSIVSPLSLKFFILLDKLIFFETSLFVVSTIFSECENHDDFKNSLGELNKERVPLGLIILLVDLIRLSSIADFGLLGVKGISNTCSLSYSSNLLE